MKPELHITNGDAFSRYFSELGIKGTVITWREMLCEGRTLHTVGTEAFWKERYEFLNKNYKVTKKSFIDLTLKQYRNLCKQKQQDEIVLWFDSDLFCQINMLGVLSWLKTHRKYAQIAIVSRAPSLEISTVKGIGELEPEVLYKLYENRIHLNQDDLEFADYAWQLYCSDNPVRIAQLSNYDSFNFPYLKQAISLHLQRFPSLKNGLNAQENILLEKAFKNNYSASPALINDLLNSQGNLGFGDIQYTRILESLHPLFSSLNPIKLKRTVKKVLSGETNYYGKIKDEKSYLGGALKYAYLYNQDYKTFLKL
jgi:hypothetical protein